MFTVRRKTNGWPASSTLTETADLEDDFDAPASTWMPSPSRRHAVILTSDL